MDATEAFLSSLGGITGTGDFHSTGVEAFFLPRLTVDGVGEIAFPLPAAQAKELIAVAEAAPHGIGMKTVHDDSVRKCWQIDATRFSIASAAWGEFLKATLARVQEDLGITGKISAHSYKLLIYGKGGHFKAHRDTEKLDAMFGTLIIALPSAHAGGRLFVRHDGREIEIDFSQKEYLHDFQYAAFFADCEHEVEPVRSGYRCSLIYNLRLDEGDTASLNLALDPQARTLLAPLAGLRNEWRGDLRAVLLEHNYTEANLSLKNLKGNDVARAKALFRAARETGFIAHLALVTFHQVGELEGGFDKGRRRRSYDDAEDGTMGEIYDEVLTISHWRNSRDRRTALGSYRIGLDLLVSREKIDSSEPDEEAAEGYTGNAGCTMEYWYRRAAIVLWLKEDHESLLCRYHFRDACAALVTLAKKKGKTSVAASRRLGEAVVACFPEVLTDSRPRSRSIDSTNQPFVLTLNALVEVGARDLLETLLGKVPADAFLLCDAGLWKKLHKAFGVETFAPVYDAILASDPEHNRQALFQMLAGLLARKEGAEQAAMIAARLARLAPKTGRRHFYEPAWWNREPRGDPDETRLLLAASPLLEKPVDLEAALIFILSDRSIAHTREILGPVIRDKSVKKMLGREGSLAPDTLIFARALLESELGCPIVAFPDWTRPCPVIASATSEAHRLDRGTHPKTNKALAELAAFMADPVARTHEFRYAQEVRSTLEDFIKQHSLDLDLTTVNQGTPHRLVCTKNSKSYQRALAFRKKDENLLDALKKL